MSDHGQIRRTAELGCGRLVEDLTLYASDKQLSEVERQDLIEWVGRFEESCRTEDELHRMPDPELLEHCYWVMSDYARGQV